MSRRVLLVEDEPSLAMLLTDRLKREGFDVEHVNNGVAAVERGGNPQTSIILLDVMLPGMDGFRVCEELRSRHIETPILMLTARGDVRDRIAGLRTGADDYLPKPFDVSELLARMEALLRRAGRPPSLPAISFGPVLVDRERKRVLRDGGEVELSFKEFQMLCYLLDRPGVPVSREELLQNVWGYQHTPNTRTVDVHMAQLRGKLEANPKEPVYLLTAHGFGYKYQNAG